jgi:hypothetical protein
MDRHDRALAAASASPKVQPAHLCAVVRHFATHLAMTGYSVIANRSAVKQSMFSLLHGTSR